MLKIKPLSKTILTATPLLGELSSDSLVPYNFDTSYTYFGGSRVHNHFMCITIKFLGGTKVSFMIDNHAFSNKPDDDVKILRDKFAEYNKNNASNFQVYLPDDILDDVVFEEAEGRFINLDLDLEPRDKYYNILDSDCYILDETCSFLTKEKDLNINGFNLSFPESEKGYIITIDIKQLR